MIIKRKTSKGKIRYGVRLDRPGRRQEWIGTFDKLADARQAESQARKSRRSTSMTCDAFAEHYLEGYRERVKDSSYDAAESALSGFSRDFRGIHMSRVSVIEAEKWARKNRWRVPVVVTLWNAAVKRELVDRNPFAGLSQRGEGRKRHTPLSVDEVEKLAQAGAKHGPQFRALVIFQAYSALRMGEAFALEWGDIDFDRMRVHVQRRVYKGRLDLPKSNRTRMAVLVPPARDALLTIRKSDGLVFTSKRGARLSQSSFAWYWASISTALDRKVDPHELRHFAAHHLYVTMGLPARVAAAQLGHDGPKLIEELYGHGDHGALEEIDRAFDNVIPLRKAQGA